MNNPPAIINETETQQGTLHNMEGKSPSTRGDQFTSTPVGQDLHLSTQYTVDISTMVQENLQAAGWLEGDNLTRTGFDPMMRFEMDACNLSLCRHIDSKFGETESTISRLLDEKLCHIRPPKTVNVNREDQGSRSYFGFDEQWNASAAAAAATSNPNRSPSLFPCIASPPPPLQQGASSPMCNFHGRQVNLDAVDENSRDS